MSHANQRGGRRKFIKRSALGLAALACASRACGAPGPNALAWGTVLGGKWQRPDRLDAFAGVHPRLFLTNQRIASLKRRIATTHGDVWSMVKEKADGYLGQLPPSNYNAQQDMREAGRGVPWQALAYLLTGRQEYLDNAKKWILTVCGFPKWQQNNSLAGGECLFGIAVGYDWLHAQFTAEERRLIREKLVVQAVAMQAGPPVHHDRWLANHNHVEHTGLAAAGFALYDEVPEAIDWIRQADLVYRQFLEVASDDGSSTEGHQYWAYTAESALRYLEMARQLLGTNYYSSTWLKRVAQFIIHSTLPDFDAKNCVMTFGDAARDYASHGPTHILYRVAAEYRDPQAQWLAREMDRRRIGRGDFCTWASLLWYDDSVPAQPLSALPTFGHSEDIGWITDRSGWDAAAVMVGFKCGPMHGHKAQHFYNQQFDEKWSTYEWIGGGHGHPDVNSFQIYAYGKWLAIDPGYETPKWTRTHNTILAGGHGQLGEGKTWFDREAVLSTRASSAVVKAENHANYDYFVGDALNFYPAASGPRKFLRHFVYFKPDIVVVVDDLVADRSANIDWLLHTEQEFQRLDGQSFVARNGGVSMDVQFLLPTAAEARVEGRTLTLSTALERRGQIISVLHPRLHESPRAAARLESAAPTSISLNVRTGSRRVRLTIDLARQTIVASG